MYIFFFRLRQSHEIYISKTYVGTRCLFYSSKFRPREIFINTFVKISSCPITPFIKHRLPPILRVNSVFVCISILLLADIFTYCHSHIPAFAYECEQNCTCCDSYSNFIFKSIQLYNFPEEKFH